MAPVKNLRVMLLLLNFVVVLSIDQCREEDSTIHCTVNRQPELLPPPSVALIHCETSSPGSLRVAQSDELSGLIDFTDWDLNPENAKPCFYQLGANCAHIFIRINSPPEQRNICICRTAVETKCTSLDLTEPQHPTTTSSGTSTTSPAIENETTSHPDASSVTRSSTTQGELDNPSLEPGGKTGNAIDKLSRHAGFVTIIVLSILFVVIVTVMGVMWVITCWHYKKKLLILQKSDMCRASSQASTVEGRV